MSHGLRLVIEIVERMEPVGDRFSFKGIAPYKQKIGSEPAICESVSGRGNRITVVMVKMFIILHKR